MCSIIVFIDLSRAFLTLLYRSFSTKTGLSLWFNTESFWMKKKQEWKYFKYKSSKLNTQRNCLLLLSRMADALWAFSVTMTSFVLDFQNWSLCYDLTTPKLRFGLIQRQDTKTTLLCLRKDYGLLENNYLVMVMEPQLPWLQSLG